jgi:EAL domain-containing protein (putative c-di-GMP-specific phosphodiesterase class I)
VAAAVARGHLEVRYQPVLDLETLEVAAADAWVVWPGAAPDDADRAAVVEAAVGAVVGELGSGAAALGAWWVRVPIGPALLVDRPFLARLVGQIDAAGLDRSRFRLGVREADLALAMVAGGLPHLAEAGLALDVHDFGVGVLCPSALRRVPVASVRVRVHGCDATDRGDQQILRSMVEVATSLGIEVIAVDIDADDELALVHATGVRLVQGYRWGTPGPLAKLLSTWARPA